MGAAAESDRSRGRSALTKTTNALDAQRNRENVMKPYTLLFAVLSAAVVSITAVAPPQALASAPMVKTQAPGYFRMMLGSFEVTALSDGTVKLPVDQLLKTSPERVKSMLAKSQLTSPVETSVNAFLINTGDKLVLIDTGAGALFGPTLGNLLANLKASGYQPEQVDEIYITHLHPDHAGGLMSNGAMAFPNAIVRADQRDVDFWLSEDNLNKAAEGDKDFFKGAMASVNPYIKAGHFKAFSGNTELVPGISAVSTHGHTAGHTSYLVQSDGQKMRVIGDLIHVGAVQLDDPSVTIAFDSDTKAAYASRHKVFDALANSSEWIAAAHLSFPGIGHLRKDGKGYRFIAVNYNGLKS
jgi:glyoxylase-like metal-dependent hydrolase (beta-lactamase superfamily II)